MKSLSLWSITAICLTFVLVMNVGVPTQIQAQPAETVPFEAELEKADKLYREGQFDQAIALTSQVLAKDDKNQIALYLRGSARIDQGIRSKKVELVRLGIEDARAAIAPTQKIEPNYYLPYLYGMTNLSELEGKPEHAQVSIKVATQVIEKAELTPDQKANLLFQRGLAKMFAGDLDGTLADYELALSQIPNHMGALMGAADAYVAAGKPEKAKESFDRAIKEYPNNALCFNNRGMFLQGEGKFQEALADFTKALQLDQKFYYLTNRGFTYMQMNQFAKAEADFDASLNIEPGQSSVYSLRGTARLNAGKLAPAIEDYRKVIAMVPQNPLSHADLGFALYFSHDYVAAGKAFDQAFSMDKEHLAFLRPWQYASKILAADPAASSIPQESAAKAEDKKEWPDMVVLFLAGKVKEAELLEATKTKGPTTEQAISDKTCEAHYFIGQRLGNMNKKDQAMQHYQQASDQTLSQGLSAYRGAQYELGTTNK
jgi:tetratricopeptide (TPR) repeat protein